MKLIITEKPLVSKNILSALRDYDVIATELYTFKNVSFDYSDVFFGEIGFLPQNKCFFEETKYKVAPIEDWVLRYFDKVGLVMEDNDGCKGVLESIDEVIYLISEYDELVIFSKFTDAFLKNRHNVKTSYAKISHFENEHLITNFNERITVNNDDIYSLSKNKIIRDYFTYNYNKNIVPLFSYWFGQEATALTKMALYILFETEKLENKGIIYWDDILYHLSHKLIVDNSFVKTNFYMQSNAVFFHLQKLNLIDMGNKSYFSRRNDPLLTDKGKKFLDVIRMLEGEDMILKLKFLSKLDIDVAKVEIEDFISDVFFKTNEILKIENLKKLGF